MDAGNLPEPGQVVRIDFRSNVRAASGSELPERPLKLLQWNIERGYKLPGVQGCCCSRKPATCSTLAPVTLAAGRVVGGLRPIAAATTGSDAMPARRPPTHPPARHPPLGIIEELRRIDADVIALQEVRRLAWAPAARRRLASRHHRASRTQPHPAAPSRTQPHPAAPSRTQPHPAVSRQPQSRRRQPQISRRPARGPQVDAFCERSGSVDTGVAIARALGLNYAFLWAAGHRVPQSRMVLAGAVLVAGADGS
jgi:hypothetical protein